MMTNADRDYNRTCVNEHIHRGVLIGHHLVHNHVEIELRLFEKRIQDRDLHALYLVKGMLRDEIRLLRCLEHDSLTEHYSIYDMDLFRSAYRSHEELFREAKSCIRAKDKLVDIYIDKEWKNMESGSRREV